MEREGKTADLTFEIEARPEGFAGTFTSMRQRVMEYPLDAVEIEGDRIRLVLAGGDILFQGDWPRLAPGFADLMTAWIRYRTIER